MDPLDEAGPPPPRRSTRFCSRPGCRRPAQPRGFVCGACTVARWRERHPEIAVERERARVFSDEQQALRRARAIVATYVRRGKIERGRCEVCNDPQTVPVFVDPRTPRENLRWLCREHRDDRKTVERALVQSRTALRDDFAAVAAEVRLLPPDVRARLHAAGLQGLTGQGAAPGSTLYWWAVRRELWRWQAEQTPLI